MGDYIPDTPKLGVQWCPGCSPERDPMREILEVLWCGTHIPPVAGLDDGAVQAVRHLSGSGEAEGVDCAAVARLIR